MAKIYPREGQLYTLSYEIDTFCFLSSFIKQIYNTVCPAEGMAHRNRNTLKNGDLAGSWL